jgi:hypothetical protein
MRFIDLTGKKYGKLTVIKMVTKRSKQGRIIWLCKCLCGHCTLVSGDQLKNKHTTSCGCKIRKGKNHHNFKHGLSRTKKYARMKRLEYYGITPRDYQIMLKKQNYKCAICKLPTSHFKKALAVDHDHKTGKVRGLLCQLCNAFLGRIESNKMRLFAITKYLKGNKNEL